MFLLAIATTFPIYLEITFLLLGISVSITLEEACSSFPPHACHPDRLLRDKAPESQSLPLDCAPPTTPSSLQLLHPGMPTQPLLHTHPSNSFDFLSPVAAQPHINCSITFLPLKLLRASTVHGLSPCNRSK